MDRVKSAEGAIKKSLSSHPMIADVRGRGLLLGVVLKDPIAKSLTTTCQKNGLLVNAPNDSVIRIAPPLNVSKSEIATFIKIFEKSLDELSPSKEKS